MNTWYATSHIHSASCKSGGGLPGIPPAGFPWWVLVGSLVTVSGGSRVMALRDSRQGLLPLVQRLFSFCYCNNERMKLSCSLTHKGVTRDPGVVATSSSPVHLAEQSLLEAMGSGGTLHLPPSTWPGGPRAKVICLPGALSTHSPTVTKQQGFTLLVLKIRPRWSES